MGSKSGQSHPRASVDHFKHMWVRNAHVAEVGVEHGTHAEQLLKRLNIALLYLVDPYIVQWKGSDALANIPMTVEESLAIYQQAFRVTRPHEGRAERQHKVKWIHKFSWDVTDEDIPETHLDFVYLDANHAYPAVKMDMHIFWEKVRKDRMMAGHDYNFPGVKKAVDEFIVEHADDIKEWFCEKGDWRLDWWILKKG